MKIFSSFDTSFKHKALQEKKEQYGATNVQLLQKSRFFLVKTVIIPFITIILIALVAGYIAYKFFDANELWTIITISMVFLGGMIYSALISKFIDYNMDYCIITPDEIILTEQSGFFKRQIRTLDAAKVKSISVQKGSVINSLFNNGEIVFMSDGNDVMGEIILDHIYNPESKKALLHTIIIKE